MFWNTFYELCHSKQMSPNKVAKELNISSGAITSWKQGKIPYPATLLKIANYFNVSVDYLIGSETSDKQPKGVKVPVFGTVAAGIPISAIEDIIDYEEIDEQTANSGEYFALKIKGDSMEPRMTSGDVVIVRSQSTIESGDIAIVLINGEEATCKKIKHTPEGIMLISLNPAYEPMFYSKKQIEELPIRILGKVVELRAKFN